MRTNVRLLLAACFLSWLLPGAALAGAPTYTISVTIDPVEPPGGTVTLDPQKDGYQKNNIVTLTAAPATGYVFTGWSGGLSGTENPATLRVGGNYSIVAHFTVSSGSGGGGGSGGGDAEPQPPTGTLPAKGMVVGYFAQWTIYRRGYLPKHVATSGALDRLNVINYAFAAPDANLRCASLDSFADYGKRFDASESVDGVADTVSQPLKGNFNQILKLKQANRSLRVLISLGGWTESYRFSDVAQPETREAFVDSCIDMFIKGNFAPGISAPGVFDGIDIDWEYPGSCGATCDYSDDDRANFVALLQLFRDKLDDLGAAKKRDYLLTIAAPAGAANYGKMDLAGIASAVDWINIMSYDYHGGWESSGPTNHISALFKSGCESPEGDWTDKAVAAYLAAGVDPSQLLLGVPFYGRGWRAASVNDGLCVNASGIPRGTYEKGVDDYEVLAAKARPPFNDEATGTHWDFDGSQFWSYDDPTSAGWKADYANCRGLRGVMFWELSGDDPRSTLLNALADQLGKMEYSCHGWSPPTVEP